MKTIIAFINEWFWMGQLLLIFAFVLWSIFVTWNCVTPDTWVFHTDILSEYPILIYDTAGIWGWFLAPSIYEKLFGRIN